MSDNTALDSEYDKTKSNLLANAEAQKAAARRKIEQQYSSRLGSGAVAKLQQEGDQGIDVATEQNMANVDVQKAQDARQERLIQQQQAYGTSERLGTQKFSGEQAAAQRQFQTGERLGSQGFQASENTQSRGLQQQQIDLANKQFETGKQQWAQEYEQNLKTNLFNKIVALKDFDVGKFDEISRIMGTNIQEARVGAGIATTTDTPGRAQSEGLISNPGQYGTWSPSAQKYL